jgi:dihydrofolate reductase
VGGSIYKQFMKYYQRLYITRVYKDFEGDAFFPEITDEWKMVWNEKKKGDEFDYEYQIYNKKDDI